MTDEMGGSSIGDFSFFCISQQPEAEVLRRIASRLGVIPRVIDYGTRGRLFFYTSYGETAEADRAIGMKLGFLRSPDQGLPFTTQQLLQQRMIEPKRIDWDGLCGNALVACFSTAAPEFSVYKTILGVPQLYYAVEEGELFASDRLKCVVRMMQRVELDEGILPLHFLFRSTPGNLTYYRNIRRLLPGEMLRWVDGVQHLEIAQTLDFVGRNRVQRYQPVVLERVHDALALVVNDYSVQAAARGQSLAALLSGGVDSSLIQYLFNQSTGHSEHSSYSFAVHVPSFEQEIEYAAQASRFLQTQHTFVEYRADDFPGLLERTIEALAQPPILETEPSMFSIAAYAQARDLSNRYFLSGQGADTLFGLAYAKKLKGLHTAARLPAAAQLLDGLGRGLGFLPSLAKPILKGSAILAASQDADAIIHPANTIAVYSDLNLVSQSFGEDVVRNAMRQRRQYAARYLTSDHYLEQVHVIDLMTDTYELGVQRQQIFLAHRREQLHPFFDDGVLRTAFTLDPEIRYIRGMQPKYLLKDLLEQRTHSAIAKKPKGFSIFERDLYAWMQAGPLTPLVQDIRLPGFLKRKDFDRLLKTPNYFLWTLLTFDLFQRYVEGDH